MSETSGIQLRAWLLSALIDLNGSGPRGDVHQTVERLFGHEFTPADRMPRMVKSIPREPAWRNNLDSLYDRMKKSGHLVTVTRGGPWTLAPAGRHEAARLALSTPSPQPLDAPPINEEELLSRFKPSSSDDYLAHVRGRILRKSRTHETVLKDYGTGVAALGWAPSTMVHPRDLELRRNGITCLAEVKVVYNGNATQAVRAAVGQLLEYRHFHYPSVNPPMLLSIFSESVGTALNEYLTCLDIAGVWRTDVGWSGTPQATQSGLVPTS